MGICLLRLVLWWWNAEESRLITGLAPIDDVGVENNPTRVNDTEAEPYRDYQIEIEVRLLGAEAEIQVVRDGKPLIRWRGLQASLGLPENSSLPRRSVPGLIPHRPVTEYRDVKLKMLDGQARLLRDRDAAREAGSALSGKMKLAHEVRGKPAASDTVLAYSSDFRETLICRRTEQRFDYVTRSVETDDERTILEVRNRHSRNAGGVVSPDGQCVAVHPKGGVLLTKPASGWNKTLAAGRNASVTAFSQDGKALAVGSESGCIVSVYDTGSAEPLPLSPSTEIGIVTGLAFSSQGDQIAARVKYGIQILDVSGESQKPRIDKRQHQGGGIGPLVAMSFSPDDVVLASSERDGTITLWDVDTRKELRQLEGHFGTGRRCLAFSPDGKLLASGGPDTLVKIYNLETGELLGTASHDRAIVALRFSDDGRTLTSGCEGLVVRSWDINLDVSGGQPKRATITPADRWTDVLPRIDLDRDVINGKWSRQNNRLVPRTDLGSKKEDRPILALPVDLPTGYEMRMSYSAANEQYGLTIHFPVGPEATNLAIGGRPASRGRDPLQYMGLQYAGKSYSSDDNPTRRQLKHYVSPKYNLILRVEPLGGSRFKISAKADTGPPMEWIGTLAELASPNSPPEPVRSITIQAWNAPSRISKLEVQAIAETPIEPADQPQPPEETSRTDGQRLDRATAAGDGSWGSEVRQLASGSRGPVRRAGQQK